MPFQKQFSDEEFITAWKQAGGVHKKVAEILGITISGVSKRRIRMIRRGLWHEDNYAHIVPDGYVVKGKSQYFDSSGNPSGVWVKSEIDKQRQHEMMMEAVRALSEQIPRVKPTPPPPSKQKNLLNQYTITDYHLGMLAWHEETNDDDWDTEIAERTLIEWFSAAIAIAPDAEVGLFCQLGDLLHFDGYDPVTPASKHLLDADTRFPKLVRVVIRTIRQVIEMLLRKHPYVHVIMADANHDPASAVWLREMLHSMYENEPRITVDNSASTYYCFEWGSTSLFYHHGHKKKPASIDDVFVSNYREVFGRTKHSYAHMGHMHHIDVKETNLMIVEQHRTLAPADAYSARGGWRSGRDAKVITYDKHHGEVARFTISPEMLKN